MSESSEKHGTCAIHGEFEKRIKDMIAAFGKSLAQTELAVLEAAREITAAAKALAAGEARLKALEESNAAQWTAINTLRQKVSLGHGIAILAAILITAGLPALIVWWLK